MKSTEEIGTKLPGVVSSESTLGELSREGLNAETEDIPRRVKVERENSPSQQHDVFQCEETSIGTDLGVKVKREIKDESTITSELVRCISDSIVCKQQELHQHLKFENSIEGENPLSGSVVSQQNSTSGCEEISIEFDLNVKTKKENEDETTITRELVGSSIMKQQELYLHIKCENSIEGDSPLAGSIVSQQNSTLGCEETSIEIDLDVKTKKENQDESIVTSELVACASDSVACKLEELQQGMKRENRIEKENLWVGSVVSQQNSTLGCEETSIEIDLSVKTKKENEDESIVTSELVRYISDSVVCKQQELHQHVKCENSFEGENPFVGSIVSQYNNTLVCEETNIKIDFDVKTKKENEGESIITSELVGCISDSVVCKLEELQPEMKYENSIERKNVLVGSDISHNSTLGCEELSIGLDLGTKTKRGNEDESPVNHELVGCFPGVVLCQKQEVEFEYTVTEENLLVEEIDSYFDDDTTSRFEDDKPVITMDGGNLERMSETSSKICCNSNSMKLVGVSVKLEDLFPSYLRKLGKGHTNTGSCSCVYCRGEYRYVCNSQQSLEDLQSKKQSSKIQADPKCEPDSKNNIKQRVERRKGPFECKQCPLKFQFHCHLNAHLKVHRNERPFECNRCPMRFKQKDSLNRHLKKKHSPERPFKQEGCPAMNEHERYLETHRMLSGEIQFECKHCHSKFTRKTALRKHMKNHSEEKPLPKDHHSDVKLFECDQCLAQFKSKFTLKRHLHQVHVDERPFECKQCPAKFKQKINLKTHMKTHSDVKEFKCNVCFAKFKHSSALKSHARLHSDGKWFECNQCGAKFGCRSNLDSHVRVHSDEKPYKCEQCHAKFKQKQGLNSHMKVHSDEKPYECNVCRAQFKHSTALKAHLRVHSDEKPFKCEQCPAKFKQAGDLKSHLMVHSGEKPFKCAQCPAKFRQASHLKGHLMVHSNEKPFKCEQCPEAFKSSLYLARHAARHSDEKRYSCVHCSAQFRLKLELMHHMKRYN